jgi:ribonucleoside-diphosphate reductase alpha chain
MTESRITYSYEEAFEESKNYFNGDELAAKVFLDKYALRNDKLELLEPTPNEMFHRIATELARIEKKKFKKPMTYDEIMSYIKDFKRIIPQGSPMAGIGNPYQFVTISNCYVVESPVDSYAGIMKTDEEIVQISKRRGGVGTDISHLRPNGTPTTNAARTSTGIIPFMERYSNTIREVGQCLYEDTLVLTTSGLKLISEVKEGDKVWTQESWVSVNKIVTNSKPCIKIKTKHGKEIICSKEHIFHTTDGEKKSIDFKVGDEITQIVGRGWSGKDVRLNYNGYSKDEYNNSNRLNEKISLPDILDEKLSYVLGYSYGDGSVERQLNGKNNCLSLSCSDDWQDIKTKLSKNIKDTFNYDVKIKSHDEACESLRLFSRLILDFLESNDVLKQKAGNLIFPEKLLEAKQDIIFSFLSGYFDADGCAQKSKKVYKIASIDDNFLLIIQNILSAFGIVSKIHKYNRPQDKWQDIYSLSINGQKSQKIFKQLMSQSVKISNTTIGDKIRDFTRSIYKTADFETNSSRHSYIIDNNQYISYSTCDRLKEDLDSNKNIFLLQDEVCSIEEYSDGEKQNVYDLCLDSEHLFFANGLYAHNSGRRGALMLTCSIHHPEILNFANSKRDLTKVTGANISIRLSDEFLQAVKDGKEYEMRWPVDSKEPEVSEMIDARTVWMKIVENAHATAEPGLLFWDNIINESPADCYADFGYKTTSTNPCGELPLCPYDSCRLLLLNLLTYVKNPYTSKAYFDYDGFYADAQIAQRFMDNLIDIEIEMIERIIAKIKKDPESTGVKSRELELWKKMKDACANGRRTGTGITALGDTLAALGYKYGSNKSIEVTEEIYKTLKLGAYRSSVDMAKELGAFKVWNHELEKNQAFLNRIKEERTDIWNDMKKYGRRNIACLTTAPAGSVSILTQTTSGIEPLYMISLVRRKKVNPNDEGTRVDYRDQAGDCWQEFEVYHPQVEVWKKVTGKTDIKESPWYGCCAEEINWQNRVKLQASANRHVDHSISSTVNLPEDVTVEEVANIYQTAWEAGTKGITVYRKNCRTGVLVEKKTVQEEMIQYHDAPKRPKELPSDVYHVSVKGHPYFVLVGTLYGEPYEIFAGDDKDNRISKAIRKGIIKKHKRGRYGLFNPIDPDNAIHPDISAYIGEEYETITRLISSNLRHGCNVGFVVHQLEKTKGDLMSFSKAVARVLKKYIKDGEAVSGEECAECGSKLIRQDGCILCPSCGFSKC